MAGSATLDQALPDTVEDLMTAEIDRLDPSDRALLRHAAVLGATFPLSVLVEMLGGEEERPDELAWRRLGDFVTEVEPGTLRFRHALLRDAAYEGLPYRRRRELHAAAGDAIARASDAEAEDRAAILSHALLPRAPLRGRVVVRARRGRSRSRQVRARGCRGALPPSDRRGAIGPGDPRPGDRGGPRIARRPARPHRRLRRGRRQLPGRPSTRRGRPARRVEALPEGGLDLGPRRALPAGAPVGHAGAPGTRGAWTVRRRAGNERACPPGTRRSVKVKAGTGR